MLKNIWNYCSLTIKASPIAFFINIIFIFFLTSLFIVSNYAVKWMVNGVIAAQITGTFDLSIVITALVFFLCMTLSGNHMNFENMLVALYTKKSQKLFSELFLFRSYQSKQDLFYENDFYNNYDFVKNNIEKTSNLTVLLFNRFAKALFLVILSSLSIAVMDPFIVAGVLALTTLLTLINGYLVKKRVALNEFYINDERRGEYYRKLLSDRAHARELRIFGLQAFFLEKWRNSFLKYSRAKLKFEIKATVIVSLVGFLRIIIEGAFGIYFIYLVAQGVIDTGECTFLIGVMMLLNLGLMEIIGILSNDINESNRYALRYDSFVGNLKSNLAALSRKSDMSPIASPPFSELSLKNVCYKYPHSDKETLKKINFDLKSGEVVSLLGYNGSGKTTLSKIICGLLENYTGNIYYNGKDIATMDKEDYYRNFGVAFQDFTRYSLTLKENIALGMVEKMDDDQQINLALEKGNLKQMAASLPEGIETILGKEYDSSGQDLSGGQWQRIILSRAYMGSPEILIFDEPTASIDPIEEVRLLSHIRQIVGNKAALLISHRIGFARYSDRICIMENGQITENGTHEELLDKKGVYYKLFMSQKKLYNAPGGSI